MTATVHALDATRHAARREAFDLAITAAYARASKRGITPVQAATELMKKRPKQLAAYTAVHGYLLAQESKP